MSPELDLVLGTLKIKIKRVERRLTEKTFTPSLETIAYIAITDY